VSGGGGGGGVVVKVCQSADDVRRLRRVIVELRPHLSSLSDDELATRVLTQIAQGYTLSYVDDGGAEALSMIGWREQNNLYYGRHIYVDDLSTLPDARGRGFGGTLLDHVTAIAVQRGIARVTLDSGHARTTAHRLYMNKGFVISAHHFVTDVTPRK